MYLNPITIGSDGQGRIKSSTYFMKEDFYELQSICLLHFPFDLTSHLPIRIGTGSLPRNNRDLRQRRGVPTPKISNYILLAQRK